MDDLNEQDMVATRIQATSDVIDSMVTPFPGLINDQQVDLRLILPFPVALYRSAAPITVPGEEPVTPWTEWAEENWGTALNATRTSRWRYCSVYFNTPRNHPANALIELSKKFPEREIFVEYASDEYFEDKELYNHDRAGSYYLVNGEVVQDPEMAERGTEEFDEFVSNIINRTFD